MERRSLLGVIGTGVAAVAGCSRYRASGGANAIPVATPNGNDAMGVDEFRYTLAKQIDVQTLKWRGNRLYLEYIGGSSEKYNTIQEIAWITGIYTELEASGNAGDGLDAVTIDSFDGQGGTFRIEADWVRQHNDGDMSKRELTIKVLESAEGIETQQE